MKKKILFVINSLGFGGAEKSLTSLLTMFDYKKYDIDLLMFRPEGDFLSFLPKEVNILPQLYFLQNNSWVKQIVHPVYLITHAKTSLALRINKKYGNLHDAQCYWKCAGNLFDYLPGNYDVAIAWGQGNPTHYVSEKVNAKKKIAVINVDYTGAGHNKNYDEPFYRKYNYIIGVSDNLTKMLKEVFPEMQDKIRTIYDINNAELIQKLAKESNPIQQKENEISIVTVGRLVKQKGYDLAIEASKLLRDKSINFKWFFVGDGPERHTLEQKVEEYGLKDRVILVGAKKNPYVYMKNADIYVQTSRFEGYCLTLGEARILNTPVISTDFDVVYNQLHDEENGLIVEKNPVAISNAIVRLWNNIELREYIISNLKKEKKGNPEEIKKLYQLIEK